MNSEEIIAIVQSVGPALVAILGVIVSCLKIISSFKDFKHSTGAEVAELRNDVKIIVAENKELKRTCRELTEATTKIKQEANRDETKGTY